MLQRFFRLSEHQTSVRIEAIAGLTTFLTMAYIIFVQPAVLSGAMFGQTTGMDFGAVTTATCLSAAIASAIMGLYARYPIAQAPGMGENFFFVLTAIPAAKAAGFENGWQVALGIVFLSGILFILLSFFGAREIIMNALSPSLKAAIAAGIGLFIAFIGLQNAGLIVKNPSTGVGLTGQFSSPDLLVFFIGFFVAAGLHARKVRSALLGGIFAAGMAALLLKGAVAAGFLTAAPDSMLAKQFKVAERIVALPPSLGPTFFKMDLAHAVSLAMWPLVVMFLFMVMFDTIGTLVGVAQQAGLIQENKLPRAREAFLSDAIGTTVGACLGTSTVTSFIESAAGVEAGGRTGLTSVTAAVLFLVALFFSPIIAMVGSYPPITAPALLLVGTLMARNVTQIDWSDITEAAPAFLVVVGIPFSFSIADGLGLGLVSYPIIKILSGKGRQVHWLVYALGVFLIWYFIGVRPKMHG